MDNIDMGKLMSMLSKMDKKDLENGLKQAQQILQTRNKDEILENLNNQGRGNVQK